MPTLRDLVTALRRRDGVEAAIVLGRDGLVVEAAAAAGYDPDSVAAHAPTAALAASDVGRAARWGDLVTGVVEYDHGLAVLCTITPDALLVVLVTPTANLGQLLYDLRRHRARIAAIV
jgi:predicted regulator of Ras-like GTPase activity (Roadblock/LC7/MglB family)